MDISQKCILRVENKLEQLLRTQNDSYKQIYEWMQYCVLNGGKRIRAQLVYASCIACDGELENADHMACALELIHAYSLVHDDLPAMDNDILRRGIPSAHIAFGEANAILIGDALQTLAFETLTARCSLTAQMQLKLINILAKASGAKGMVFGQVLDLNSENHNLDHLKNIHKHKTGALIEASVQSGALIANADKKTMSSLEQYAQKLGLAFQVQDDVLDVVSNTDKLGKTCGKDKQQNKITYVDLLGLEKAQNYVSDLIMAAKSSISNLGKSVNYLLDLADFVLHRKN